MLANIYQLNIFAGIETILKRRRSYLFHKPQILASASILTPIPRFVIQLTESQAQFFYDSSEIAAILRLQPGGLQMDSKARLLGHSVHPMLIVFPLGLLGTAVIFDIIRMFSVSIVLAIAAYWMLAAGIIGGLF